MVIIATFQPLKSVQYVPFDLMAEPNGILPLLLNTTANCTGQENMPFEIIRSGSKLGVCFAAETASLKSFVSEA